MKKIALAIVLAFSLAGCAGQSIFHGGPSITATISNPVTPTMLYEVENAITVAFVGLNTYKRACVAKTIDQSCRGVIQKLQVYTRKLPPVLKNLRAFVRNNDQINAITAYNTIRQLLSDFQGVALASGVR